MKSLDIANMSDLEIAAEAIDFQKDSFGKKLENYFDKLINEINADSTLTKQKLQNSDYPKILHKMIFDRFGIKLNIVFNTEEECCVFFTMTNYNNVLRDKEIRIFVTGQYDYQKQLNEKGTVDLKNARLGGIFSKNEHDLHLNIFLQINKYLYTVKELAAVVLHEIGHIFTTSEFEDRMESSNQVLSNLSENIKNNGDPKKRIYLLKELSKTLGNTDFYFDELHNANERVILGLGFFKKYIKLVESQLSLDNYDRTSGEQLADNFASRFGYGRNLVTGLDKLYRLDKHPDTSSEWHFYIAFREFRKTALYLVQIIFNGVIATIVPLAALASIVLSLLLIAYINSKGEFRNRDPYDTLIQRYNRIKAQSTQRIKNGSLNANELKYELESIKQIDGFMADIKPYQSPLTKFSNYIFSQNKRATDNILVQQLLEELSHNSLFIKSAEIDLLVDEKKV